jgi:hypothetical protein
MKKISISLLTPTRGRPDRYRQYLCSIVETASDPSTIEIVSYIDNDDELMLAAKDDIVTEFSEVNIKFIGGERLKLSEANQACCEASSGEILMLNGDDIIFRTQDWDKCFEEAFERLPAKIGLVFADDGAWHEKFAVFPTVSRAWVDTLGYLCSGFFPADFDDSWIYDIARRLDDISKEDRIIYLGDVLLEHMHFSLGKAEFDETYSNLITARRSIDYDGRFYVLSDYRQGEAEKLQRKTEEITGCESSRHLSPLAFYSGGKLKRENLPLSKKSHVEFDIAKLKETVTVQVGSCLKLQNSKSGVEVPEVLSSLLKSVENDGLNLENFPFEKDEIIAALAYATANAATSPWGAFNILSVEDKIADGGGCPVSQPVNNAENWLKLQWLDGVFGELKKVLGDDEKLAFFGAGQHCLLLLEAIKNAGLKGKLVAICDDKAVSGQKMNGISVVKPEAVAGKISYIIISTDAYEDVLAKRSEECFGGKVKIVCPYSFAFVHSKYK